MKTEISVAFKAIGLSFAGAALLIVSATSLRAQPVLINEVMASNRVTLADEDGDYEDWIELHNTGDEEVSLSGHGLSDDYGNPFRWTFPEGAVIAPRDFLLVWASGKDRRDADRPLHANFSIRAAGEEVLLTRDDGVRLDELVPTVIPRDVSYGRSADGSGRWVYFPNPTPGAANAGEEFEELLESPRFSHSRGFYSESFDLEIRLPGGAGDLIRYTLDGREPERSPNAVTGIAPVTVRVDPDNGENRWEQTPAVTVRAQSVRGGWATATETHTYIFLPAVIRQPDLAPGGDHVFWHTRMDPEVTGDERYQGMMEESLQAIPTLSVVLDPEEFSGVNGIHRGQNLTRRWDRRASVELIYPDSPRYAAYEGFQVNAGVRIQGAGGRWDEGRYDPKQSFTIKFSRSFGGPGRLHYPFFEAAPLHADRAAANFNRLILRAGHNKSWPGPGPSPRQWTTYTRQQFLRDSQNAAGGLSSHGTFMHLYINGIYWGLYNPSERVDQAWMATYHGGEPEDYWYVKMKGSLSATDRFQTMLSKVGNPATPYSEVKEYLDTANFIDWQLIMMLMGTSDYEWTVAHGLGPEAGPVFHYIWDCEDSLEPNFVWDPDVSHSSRGNDGYRWWQNSNSQSDVFRRIRNHPEFRMEFADRLYRHCVAPDGALNDTRNKERWLALADDVEAAVVAESARWGRMPPSSRGGPPHIPPGPINRDDHWYKARDVVLDILEGNAAKMVNDLRARGLYPHLNPPVLGRPSGSYARGTELLIDNPNGGGTVYVTLNGLDPRTEGGAVHSAAATIDSITLEENVVVKARVKDGATWSALNEVELMVTPGFLDEEYYRLSEGPYTFSHWPETAPAGTYPPHMAFLQTLTPDSLAGDEMDAYWSLPYNLASRSRINGLEGDGFAFINTANAQDVDGAGFVGAAVLALDTSAMRSIHVSWRGGTVELNSRVYALHLQYRIGNDGPFLDVRDPEGEPVVYRAGQSGHSELIGPVLLSAETNNQPKVQLRWKYSFTGIRLDPNSGQRSQLRVGDITVFGGDASRTYDSWKGERFSPGVDASLGGPWADPSGYGIPNLVRYVFNMDAAGFDTSALPQVSLVEGRLSISFIRDPSLADITYIVEASADLIDWSEVLYDSSRDLQPNNEGERMRITDSGDGSDIARFLRLLVSGSFPFSD